MNCKQGDLAVVVGSEYDGMIVTCVKFIGAIDHGDCKDYWQIDRQLSAYHTGQMSDSVLRPIRDQPGNEQFVVESRKSLPRKKPVTGPVTIDARGEVVR